MPPGSFPVPVLSAALVACPGCKAAVMRLDLPFHFTVCPGRVAEERESETMPA